MSKSIRKRKRINIRYENDENHAQVLDTSRNRLSKRNQSSTNTTKASASNYTPRAAAVRSKYFRSFATSTTSDTYDDCTVDDTNESESEYELSNDENDSEDYELCAEADDEDWEFKSKRSKKPSRRPLNHSANISNNNSNNNNNISISNDSADNLPGESRAIRKAKALSRWKSSYAKIQEMRKKVEAPVDSIGCSMLHLPNTPVHVQRFQILVSLMLSSQTKDQMTAKAVRQLQTKLQGGLTVNSIHAAAESRIDELINCVGFHNRKSKYLKETAKIIIEKHNGKVPQDIDTIMTLKGVGPKMAYLYYSTAFEKSMGIGVDVHVHRIANRLGWVTTTTPEKTRALEDWLPKSKWIEINPLLVGFGQTICKPVGAKCVQCTLSDTCPSAFLKKKKKK